MKHPSHSGLRLKLLMPKLPVISGKELIAALKKAGFVEMRQKGSHVSLEKITFDKTYRTVVPMHQELAIGTLLDILQQTGLSRDDLFRLLK
jgi:predicted RNA binding protein YcfA (HicA-like mRNA interferase family)